jgi:phage terminase Nu1 subunit (DNA packaging protein)
MADRAGVEYVMDKTGLSRRTVQAMAARGQIPGAAKFGKLWTFDRMKLARWIRDKERECQSQATSTSVTAFSMRAFRLPVPSGVVPLRQRIAERRRGA